METFKFDVDADGIALVTFDVPGRSMNTLTGVVMRELPEVVERIKTDASIKGAVITSGKATGFCAGADLGEIAERDQRIEQVIAVGTTADDAQVEVQLGVRVANDHLTATSC